ncbi:hypothetical protein [Shewanella woodyi]|uniref:hypothetical protein n=1 Tax=Shewanella woodyi TaxID=60961 RepID=UPI00059D99C4|nr:hypothetical protein [Shewanella woodyi]
MLAISPDKPNRRDTLAFRTVGVDAAASFGSMEAAVKPTRMCSRRLAEVAAHKHAASDKYP